MAERNRWRGAILGAVGGAIGTLVMGYYFQALARLNPAGEQGSSGEDNPDEQRSHALDDVSLMGKHYRDDESSTVTVGRLAYGAAAGEEPKTQETRTTLSQLVHWGFGTAMGALYGATRSGTRPPDLAGGAVFGAAVWLFASELMLPLLGLAPGPTVEPARQHATQFGAHLVYGATVAATTRLLERLVASRA
ncbi:MAG: DUF1440 domain-containing protein [Chloroflexales bacterium]|nr:DUF1440 domain-containing protein [Chloroflexales bacterium]